MIWLDGKGTAAQWRAEIAHKVQDLPRRPGLAVILVGDDPASRTYVNGKRRDCETCGLYSEEYTLPAETAEGELLDLISVLNTREDIDGILVQLPLPSHLSAGRLLAAISPEKDVDGLHPVNMGKLLLGDPTGFTPCTPLGVLRLLEAYSIPLAGKDCVMVGRSSIVGKPLAALLTRQDATVTLCHSQTANLVQKTATADILLSAVGKMNFITEEMVKPGAVLVDISINRDEAGKLHGDARQEALAKASYATPVPGGVGPMTRAALMWNTYLSAYRRFPTGPRPGGGPV